MLLYESKRLGKNTKNQRQTMPLIIALIKTLTLKKIGVLLRAQWHYVLARYFKQMKTSRYTPFITLEASNRCQLHCPECATGSQALTRTKGELTFKQYQQIIDEIYPYTSIVNLYMQGEPYLNNELGKMIAYAKSKHLFVSLSTNAQLIPQWKKENLPQHIIISADGATQANYEKYRVGGQLKKVLAFAKELTEYKATQKSRLPYIELQFLVNRYNLKEVNDTKRLFKGYYNRFVKKTMQIIHPTGEHFLPQEKKARRQSKTHLTSGCYKMISTTVVTQDGRIVPCCMDKDAKYTYAHSSNTNIANANTGEKSKQFHTATIMHKAKIDICKNCPFA